jgi:hypothetical protein
MAQSVSAHSSNNKGSTHSTRCHAAISNKPLTPISDIYGASLQHQGEQ